MFSIYRYYDRSGQSVRVPDYMRKRIWKYTRERERQRENGEPATDESIKKALGLTDYAFRTIMSAMRALKLESLDNPLDRNDSDSGTVLDMIAGYENVSETALAGSYEKDLHNLLQSALRELPEKERTVIYARHYQKMKTAHIATVLQCSPPVCFSACTISIQENPDREIRPGTGNFPSEKIYGTGKETDTERF